MLKVIAQYKLLHAEQNPKARGMPGLGSKQKKARTAATVVVAARAVQGAVTYSPTFAVLSAW